MNSELIPFSTPELCFIACYLLSLVFIGWLGFRARQEDSLRDFYLAGKGVGFIVLLLTLYATQYSGNTLFAFTGKTYRVGYAWATSIHFMTAIVVFYLLLAPRLYRLAKQHDFITPTDFIRHRYQSPALSMVTAVMMIVAISNFLLAQLMAMGNALEGLTKFDPATAYTVGVIVLAVIIVVYETLGGFRAVAWTDVIQGGVLLVGFFLLLGMVFVEYGSLEEATQTIMARESAEAADVSKVAPPDTRGSLEWLSYILLVGIGGALYPQAVQRIYAARSATALRRSLAVMAFLPLATALIALIVGIIGLAHIPNLIGETDRADTVLTVICRRVQEGSVFGRGLVVVLFSAILAATMSTADSVLLSISSMFTKDVYARVVSRKVSEKELTRVGKVASWVLVAFLVFWAIRLRGESTLVQLLDRKFDLLVQLAPAFFIGLHWPQLRAGPVLAGIICGVVIAIGIPFAPVDLGLGKKPFGIHPGLYGLAVNTAIAWIGSMNARERPSS